MSNVRLIRVPVTNTTETIRAVYYVPPSVEPVDSTIEVARSRSDKPAEVDGNDLVRRHCPHADMPSSLSTVEMASTDLLATARHEAGHVVAHLRLGIDQDQATIVSKTAPGGQWIGAVAAEGAQHVWNKEQAGPMVLAFAAGYAALVAAGYSDDAARIGADDDFEQAAHLIDFWGLVGGFEAWLMQAVEFMRRPENVAAVAMIADHLLQHETLDGECLSVLVDVADGNCTEAEFAQYLRLRDRA